jgi:hypothetical protein
MSNHTPGPWVMGEANNCGGSYPRSLAVFPKTEADAGNGRLICLVSSLENVNEEDEANAMLIAAAPELLASCRAMIEAMEYDGGRAVGALYHAKLRMKDAIVRAEQYATSQPR